MSCHCFGVNYHRCKCIDRNPSILLKTQSTLKSDHRTALFARKSNFSFRCKDQIRHRKGNYVTMLVKGWYDSCAAYNLRYCPFEGITGRCRTNTIARDMVVLFCFLVANLIVLGSIFIRIVVHTIDYSLQFGRLIKRFYKRFAPSSSEVKKITIHRSAYANDVTKMYDYYS